MIQGIKRWEMVEVVIPANSSQTTFRINDQPNLRMDSTQDIVIVGLEVYNANALPFAFQSQQPGPTPAQLANTALTLYVSDEESVHLIPCVKLNALKTALATATDYFSDQMQEFKNLVSVNWDKSYFQVAQPYNFAAPNAQFCLTLGVSYLKLKPGQWAALTSGQIQGL
jgi:hypothetical protein